MNIELKRTGTKLIVEIDLAATGAPSASGKTTVIASTHGNIDVPGSRGIKLGINCYSYPGSTIEPAVKAAA